MRQFKPSQVPSKQYESASFTTVGNRRSNLYDSFYDVFWTVAICYRDTNFADHWETVANDHMQPLKPSQSMILRVFKYIFTCSEIVHDFFFINWCIHRKRNLWRMNTFKLRTKKSLSLRLRLIQYNPKDCLILVCNFTILTKH